jgi:hypothetical protein
MAVLNAPTPSLEGVARSPFKRIIAMKATARTAANPLPQVPPTLQITSAFEALDTRLHTLQHDVEMAHTVMHALADTQHPTGQAVGHVALKFLDKWAHTLRAMRDDAEIVNRGLDDLPRSA